MTIDVGDVPFAPEAFAPLLAEAEGHGGAFLLRLRDEWLSGDNRFCRRGEFLLGVRTEGKLIAVGGISHDPYDPAPGLGRVRHVYVLEEYRRQGIGRALVAGILERASRSFTHLRLRTRNRGAARLYESLGFVRSSLPNETHRLVF